MSFMGGLTAIINHPEDPIVILVTAITYIYQKRLGCGANMRFYNAY